MAEEAAVALVDKLNELTEKVTDRLIDLAVAGGFVSTDVLAAVRPHIDKVDWSRIRVWAVDERWVHAGTDERNAIAAQRALFDLTPDAKLRWLPASDDGLSPHEAVVQSEEYWNREIGHRGVDLALLGMGEDGHVASLFPHHKELDMEGPVLFVLDSPKPPSERLTVSMSVLLEAHERWVLTAGEGKAEAIGAVFSDDPDERAWPIAALRVPGTHWWMDVAAASMIEGV